MKPIENKYLFFTESHSHLFSSLQRYINYILDQKLDQFSETEFLASPTVLFVYQEERENPELLKIVANNNNIKIIVIGFDSRSSINLIDFANLKNNFVFALINIDSRSHQLFTDSELKEKLKNFFHSHGDDSLFEHLNWAYYFLRNGPEQLLNKLISYEEYENSFLIPGLKKWDYFKSRFNKYKDIIKLSSYKAILEKLENSIDEANTHILGLSKLSEDTILKKNITFFNENIDKIKKIGEILTTFYKDF